MYRLVAYIPILGSFLLKMEKECVYMIMLKIKFALVKMCFFDLKMGISRLLSWIAPKHTTVTKRVKTKSQNVLVAKTHIYKS